MPEAFPPAHHGCDLTFCFLGLQINWSREFASSSPSVIRQSRAPSSSSLPPSSGNPLIGYEAATLGAFRGQSDGATSHDDHTSAGRQSITCHLSALTIPVHHPPSPVQRPPSTVHRPTGELASPCHPRRAACFAGAAWFACLHCKLRAVSSSPITQKGALSTHAPAPAPCIEVHQWSATSWPPTPATPAVDDSSITLHLLLCCSSFLTCRPAALHCFDT